MAGTFVRGTFLSLSVLALSACGGGGGGGGDDQPSLTTVNEAEPNQTTDTAQAVGNNVEISGSVLSGNHVSSETEPNDSQRVGDVASLSAARTVHIEAEAKGSNNNAPDPNIVIRNGDIIVGSVNGTDDTQDFFRFIPTTTGTVSIRLEVNDPALADLQVQLIDPTSAVLATGDDSIWSNGFGNLMVTAGVEYSVRVFTVTATGTALYNLIVTRSDAVWLETEDQGGGDNDSTTDADFWVPQDFGDITIGDVTETTDESDFTRITAGQTGVMNVYLRFNQQIDGDGDGEADNDLDLYIYDSDGTTVLDSSTSTVADERASVNVVA
ncbi:MAG: hypothetical protein AAF420_05440 [Pseudomonadota bacterium]